MRPSHAGGRKTHSDAARPAFGNALEAKIETVLAAMAKSVEAASARATMDAYCEERRHLLDSAARLGGACAALVSAAARLNGEFKHDIQVRHLHENVGEEYEDKFADDYDSEVPLFTSAELRSLTPEELVREIPIREAAYWARKAAEVMAATAGIPAPLRAPPPVVISALSAPARSAAYRDALSAPASAGEVARERSERDEGGDDAGIHLHPALAAFEQQLAALEDNPGDPVEEDA